MSKPLPSLLPSIDQRLAAWETIQRRLGQSSEPKVRPTVTLSRAFGCEGYPLAEALKARFEAGTGEPWNIYDKALVEQVARTEGISERMLLNLGDASRVLDALGLSSRMTHDEAFQRMAKYVVEVGRLGNAIIVGRGGAVLCSSYAHAYHFRLEGSLDFRIRSVMRRLGLSQVEAEALVKENSRLREQFLGQQLGVDLHDRSHYHAVFSNERQSVEAIADAILALVRAAWPHREPFTGLPTALPG